MIQSEAQLEQQFLEKLQEMKYTYRSDIRDLDALERNFRQKFERLNFVSLSRMTNSESSCRRTSRPMYSPPPSACARNKHSCGTMAPPSTIAL